MTAAGALAQDANIIYAVPTIEQRLREAPFQVLGSRGSRMADDRTQQAQLSFEDGATPMQVKWAIAPPGGDVFNNSPRNEVGAYEIQRLFLDESEYVVPPTVVRAFPLTWYRAEVNERARSTFGGTESVLVVLQYWLSNVTNENFWDPKRFDTDTLYARHFANFNTLTYLIHHNDANTGNFLVSRSPDHPRVFSVDNGVAFGSEESNRGYMWRDLQVKRLPAATVERLRTITPEDLERVLGVLAQFDIVDRQLVPAAPGENSSRNQGVRKDDTILQLGLTAREIRDVRSRLERLLRQVDEGRITTF